jgi:hypothetical protein
LAFGPGAPGALNDNDQMRMLWDRLGTIAEKYLRALEIRSRLVHTHGRELAEAVLREREKWHGSGK